MTKGERRRARREARAEGRPLAGDLAVHETRGDRDRGPVEWSESRAGQRARERWYRHYDALNGAPENDEDR